MDVSTASQTEASKNRIIINVGGFRHETHLNTLLNIPDTRLSWIVENQNVFDSEKKEYFFDRHPGAFSQVLNYFRTGQLHCPTDMCGPMFEQELMFWGIDEKQMEPCCWAKYTQHREAEENLKAFVGPGFEPDLKQNDMRRSTSSLLSGFEKESWWQKVKPKVWEHLDEPHSSKLAKFVSYLSCFFISLSIATFCVSTLPEMRSIQAVGDHKGISEVETVCSIFFTIEFVMRFVFCPSKFKFMKTPMDWIDFLAIVPFYVHLVIRSDIVKMFLVIRVFRLFRFIKLSYGLQIIIHTLKASSHELVLLLLMLLIPVVLFSSIVYYIEFIMHNEDSTFTSVPISFWWCLITMTTVGYGDMTPQTWPGKVVGGACAVCGVLIVAMPISIIGSNFNLYYAHAQARLKLPMKQRRLVLGGVPGLITKHQELSSRRKKKSPFPSSQLLDQEMSCTEGLSLQMGPVPNVTFLTASSSDEICPDTGNTRSALSPLLQDNERMPQSANNQLARRRPRRTTATLLPMAQLQAEAEKWKEETDIPEGLPTTLPGEENGSLPICEQAQEMELKTPSPCSHTSSPVLVSREQRSSPPIESPDYADSDGVLSTNSIVQSTQDQDFGSNELALRKEEGTPNGTELSPQNPSQLSESGSDKSLVDDDHSLHPCRDYLWRRKSVSDSKLFPLPDKELSEKDLQPAQNRTKQASPKSCRRQSSQDLQRKDKLKNNTSPHRDKFTGNGTSFRDREESSPGSRPRAVTQNGRPSKCAVIATIPTANRAEQDFLETNI